MKKLCYVNEKISLRKKTHQTFQKILSREHHTLHMTTKSNKEKPSVQKKTPQTFQKVSSREHYPRLLQRAKRIYPHISFYNPPINFRVILLATLRHVV